MSSEHSQSQAQTPQRVSFLRAASSSLPSAPTLMPRWLHASENGKTWTPFGNRDHSRLEEAWNDNFHSWQEWKRIRERVALGKKLGKGDVGNHLYEVDLRLHKLSTVFWKSQPTSVRRGTWFLDGSKLTPCTDAVAEELESLWGSIKPYLPSYAEELRSSVSLGSDADDKLKCRLQSQKSSYVIFLGPYLARIYADDVSTRFAKTIWTAWSGEHAGGTLVARGYDNAQQLLKTRGVADTKSSTSGSSKKTGQTSGTATPPRVVSLSTDKTKKSRPASSSSNHSGSSTVVEEKQNLANRASGLHQAVGRPSGDAEATRAEATAAAASTDASGNGPTLTSASLPANENTGTQPTSRPASGTESFVRSLGNRLSMFGVGGIAGPSPFPTQDIRDSLGQTSAGEQEAGELKEMEGEKSKASAGLGDGNDNGADRGAEGQSAEMNTFVDEDEEEEEPPEHLVLVWHGIGQKLAEEWKSLDFALAVSSMRTLMSRRAASKPPSDVGGGGLPGLIGGRRVQFIPVMWRSALDDFQPPRQEEGDEDEHLDNQFGLEQIFGSNEKDSIPFVKTLISGVALDIPFYLSHHKGEIMNRVRAHTNFVWRLWNQRNPRFLARGGKTHLIAHSLGAAIAADVLSAQPTFAGELGAISSYETQLVFDVSSLYLLGSPVALFMWLQQAQLIARKGREGTKDSSRDEALERSGRFGCLAVDRCFNIAAMTDPIGTRLNACVDARYAQIIKPHVLAKAVTAILRGQPGALSESTSTSTGIFGTWARGSSGPGGARPSSSAQDSDEANAPDGGGIDTLGLMSTPLEASAEDVAGSAKTAAESGSSGSEWIQRFAPKKVKAAYAEKRNTVSAGAMAAATAALAQVSATGQVESGSHSQASTLKSAYNLEQEVDFGATERPSTAEAEVSEKAVESDADGMALTQRSRAERRMRALSPLGSVDFVIPLQASLISHQYLEMLYSHAGYWQDPSFADFLLATLFSTREQLDQARQRLEKPE
ncbi:Phosphatidic acid-preferring phospholipase A1, contains DDHD domain [Ceraceosorus bombacis]|uniref:Phosphatidic acid-preferring phospholipase A1, contains DDHD domain n=1 Tax=Ceraceosorus bombacis TaxID=401625 RepID=A0A0P1BIH7_9BASI|nr:Phosphatidic acid-preferring phospholipase A1, contains DDHD domain [Ceraceosorus bombacis]